MAGAQVVGQLSVTGTIVYTFMTAFEVVSGLLDPTGASGE
jgi:hypothetical protein